MMKKTEIHNESSSITFIKKPKLLRAFQFSSSPSQLYPDWFRRAMKDKKVLVKRDKYGFMKSYILTPDEKIRVNKNDWIVQNACGGIYAVPNYIFRNEFCAVKSIDLHGVELKY